MDIIAGASGYSPQNIPAGAELTYDYGKEMFDASIALRLQMSKSVIPKRLIAAQDSSLREKFHGKSGGCPGWCECP
ncbi:MAG: hypothetical protein IPH78_15030 [Bacteroidetes bacterium]|nr:hypothetical protein [Bacteroidota bacterium]